MPEPKGNPSVSIPGKAFLFGEYAALKGAPAVIACFAPEFAFYPSDSIKNPFHPDSIAGRYFVAHPLATEFHDPFFGKGGMGASSAEFIGLIKQAEPELDAWQIRDRYFEFAAQAKRPSGYDVLAQAHGKAGDLVYVHANQKELHTDLQLPRGCALHIFHTNKKLPTHVHLDNLQFEFETSAFDSITENAVKLLQLDGNGDPKLLGSLMNHFDEVLNKFGFVARHTRDYVDALKGLPNVLGVKGSGAMGSDLILALTDANCLQNDWQPVADLEKIAVLRGEL